MELIVTDMAKACRSLQRSACMLFTSLHGQLVLRLLCVFSHLLVCSSPLIMSAIIMSCVVAMGLERLRVVALSAGVASYYELSGIVTGSRCREAGAT